MSIVIWNGTDQKFGHIGQPQRWINILGTVSEPQSLQAFVMRINGGDSLDLNVGPDGLRLRGAGDFNAEIPVSELIEGVNEILFIAVQVFGQIETKTVRVTYTPKTTWPLPYDIHWKDVLQASDAVQIVDGYWWLTDAGIRTVNPAYDRLVTLGDHTWTDYCVRAVITLHGFVPGQDGGLQGGIGILTRWTGHYPDAHQPNREWRPNGTIGWYRARWEDNPPLWRNYNISDAVIEDRAIVESSAAELEKERPAVFEMSVKSLSGSTSRYQFRVWYQDSPHVLLCDLTANGTAGESTSGSILFIALYADVTIGEIEVMAY